ncbi:GRR1 (YJR090C) [Zygosaccharomyces parabailii]|nr:GRR1 (YJR090C) [Zygosaccharomyces parabailii]
MSSPSENEGNNNLPRGLPASWFTNFIPPRESLTHQGRETLSREHRQRVSRITQNENTLRDIFRINPHPQRQVPHLDLEGLTQQGQGNRHREGVPVAESDFLPDGPSREINLETFNSDAAGSANGGASNLHAFPETDVNMFNVVPDSLDLKSDDLRKLYAFQRSLQQKVQAYLDVIEKRRNGILDEISIDNCKLEKMRLTDSPQAVNFINKLQRMRLRAIESETMELQRLRVRFLTVVEEYRKAMNEYCKARVEGRQAQNPTDYFQQWIESLDPNESSVSEGLQELSSCSKLLMNNLYTSSHHAFAHNDARNNVFALKNLPSEILYLILEKLSHKSDIVSLLTVCKLWAEIIVKILYYRPHINKKAQLDLFMRTMSFASNETVFDYRSMIKRLNFSFVGDYMHDEELYNFVGCRNLERLTLVFCKHVTSDSISEVLKGCRYLQSVDITGIKEISDNIFDTLAENCPRVQGFYVPQAKNVTSRALSNFITHAPMLKRVKITANNNMDDGLVELFAEKCPMLVEFDITLSPNVHDHSLLHLFTKLTQLREFRVTHNINVTDKLLLELSKNVNQLPSLRLLDLSGCENITDKTIERVVALAPKLRNVFLGKCSRITDYSLHHLAKLGKNLQTVHFGHCFNISDQGVRTLVQSCPRIQYVDFACCTNLTNRTLYELSDLAKLKRIGLVKCSQMTDEGLLNMLSLRGRNDSLERVHLSYCSNLTIYPIYELLMACPRLSHLSLTAVPSFLRPDITSFCRPAPADFSDNQRQIFCVFSGKGVHKLRHYLMSLTTPTSGPQTDLRDVLTKYVSSRNLLQQGEDFEIGMNRIIGELNQDSAAILAATGLSQMNGMNNDFLFQNIDFDKLDDIFNWYEVSIPSPRLTPQEIKVLLSMVDKRFCEDPYDEEYDDINVVVAPGADHDLNNELCLIVRKFHELFDRVNDFEVNVASLARVQFQFTGFLLHEMAQVYMQMVDLNRQISQIQKFTYDSGLEASIKGFSIWRLLFIERFAAMVKKYKLSTVVLRLYLKDSITLLTRQRELFLAHQRSTWNPNNDNEEDPIFWQQFGDRVQLSPDQMRIIQLGLRGPPVMGGNGLQPIMDVDNINQVDGRSGTPDEDTVLEDA